MELQICVLRSTAKALKSWYYQENWTLKHLAGIHSQGKCVLGRVHLQFSLSPTRKLLMRMALTKPRKPEYKRVAESNQHRVGPDEAADSCSEKTKLQVRKLILSFSFLGIRCSVWLGKHLASNKLLLFYFL